MLPFKWSTVDPLKQVRPLIASLPLSGAAGTLLELGSGNDEVLAHLEIIHLGCLSGCADAQIFRLAGSQFFNRTAFNRIRHFCINYLFPNSALISAS